MLVHPKAEKARLECAWMNAELCSSLPACLPAGPRLASAVTLEGLWVNAAL